MVGMDKQEAMRFLDSVEKFGYKLGLERVQAALELLGHPERSFKSVHVAGTNGKGSTSVFIASILQQAGFRVGLYTSPHILEINERIRIKWKKIPDADFVLLVEEIRALDEKNSIGLSHFEFLTVLALIYFSRKKVDFAVAEVGMGGRLDATNVLLPEVSVITNIALEHEEWLGKSLLEIAREKAGIIKQGVPLVTAEKNPEVLDLFREICNEKNSQLAVLGKDFPIKKLKISLGGKFQQANANLAVAAVRQLKEKIPASAIEEGLLKADWQGRFEIVRRSPIVLFDAAHNPAAAKALASALEEFFPKTKVVFVFGCSSDKNVGGLVGALAGRAKFFYITKAKYRGMEVGKIEEEAAKRGIAFETIPPVSEAVKIAIKNAAKSDVVCVCGSIFVLGEAAKDFY